MIYEKKKVDKFNFIGIKIQSVKNPAKRMKRLRENI